MDERKRRVDPAELPGSPDAGLAPEWPQETPEESSVINDERIGQSSDSSNTGHITEDVEGDPWRR